MELTQQTLKSLLRYDSTTGEFIWLVNRGRNFQHIGKLAGTVQKSGHISIRINGTKYLSHRLAWLYMTGSWPDGMIDHSNGNPSDNRFINLRVTDSSGNNRNSRKRKTNKSGYKGVSFFRKTEKWRASIVYNRRNISLGLFENPEDAHKAYVEAAKRLHGDFARFD